MPERQKWEYGFYDSDDVLRRVWWYVFGLPHLTAASALHTGRKSTWGDTVLVKRHAGSTNPDVWVELTEAEHEAAWDEYAKPSIK